MREIFPGAASGEIEGLTPFQGRVWFSALPDHSQGKELWSSDGTAAGTGPLRPDLSAVHVLGVHLGRLWFAADGPQGRELWSTDGTEAGTRVLDLVPGAGSFSPIAVVSVGDRIFFSGDRATAPGLWVSDGTLEGTRSLGGAELRGNAASPIGGGSFAVVGDTLFYLSFNEGELWQSDGTVAGTIPVPGPVPGNGSEPIRTAFEPTAFQGKLIFIWRNGLWQADGTAGGTVEIPGSFREPRELTVAGPRLFFAATDPVHGRELWALE